MKFVLLKTPILILNDLYDYLNLELSPLKDPCHQIWDHDAEVLSKALSFYHDLEKRSGIKQDYQNWEKTLGDTKNPSPKNLSEELWTHCLASHKGFQLGNEILKILPKIGLQSGFFELGMDENLNALVPEKFSNSESVNTLVKMLNPPPKAKSNEIVAPMGGMFYSREAPNLPPMLKAGDHFKAGQALFIIEVMKMFNKISAPFSGTVVKSLLEDSDGKIITKGQPIFQIQPDEILKEETEEEVLARKKSVSLGVVG